MNWRALRPDERKVADVWFVVALLCLGLLPFWNALAPAAPGCALRTVSGVPCPTCGTTRAVTSILDGRFMDGALWNPLAVAGLAVFVAVGLVAPVWTRTVGSIPTVPSGWRWPIRIAAVAVLIANWGWLVWNGV